MNVQSRALGVFGVVGEGFRLFGSKFFDSLLLGLLAAVFLALPKLSIALGWIQVNVKGEVAHQPMYLAMVLIAFVLSCWPVAALFALFGAATQQQKLTIKSFLGFATARYPTAAGVAILVLLMVLFGSMLLIIPGVILFVYCFASKQSAVFEGKNVFAALGNSFRLVSGSWWHSCGVSIIVSLFILIGAAISFAVVTIAVIFAQGGHEVQVFSFLVYFLPILNAVLIMLLFPLSAAIMTSFYFNLKCRKSKQLAREAALDELIKKQTGNITN